MNKIFKMAAFWNLQTLETEMTDPETVNAVFTSASQGDPLAMAISALILLEGSHTSQSILLQDDYKAAVHKLAQDHKSVFSDEFWSLFGFDPYSLFRESPKLLGKFGDDEDEIFRRNWHISIASGS